MEYILFGDVLKQNYYVICLFHILVYKYFHHLFIFLYISSLTKVKIISVD